jgi:hypothetical protein
VPPVLAPLVRGLAFPLALLVRRYYLTRLLRRPARLNIGAAGTGKSDKGQLGAKV